MKIVLPGTFLVLLTLKLMEYIAVSWWIVFAPLIAYGVLLVLVFVLVFWAAANQ